jgi:hypothetical protein
VAETRDQPENSGSEEEDHARDAELAAHLGREWLGVGWEEGVVKS